jgi:hypothetical protein
LLHLSSEENELGHQAEDAYEHFATQIRAFKLEAQHQADKCAKTEVQEKLQSAETDAQMSTCEDEDNDTDGEVEEESVQRAKGKCTIARGRKIVSF